MRRVSGQLPYEQPCIDANRACMDASVAVAFQPDHLRLAVLAHAAAVCCGMACVRVRGCAGYRRVLGPGEEDPLHALRVMSFAKAMLRISRGVTMPNTGG